MKKYLINFLVATMVTSTLGSVGAVNVSASGLDTQNIISNKQDVKETNYEDLRNQWVNELTGNASYDETDEDMS